MNPLKAIEPSCLKWPSHRSTFSKLWMQKWDVSRGWKALICRHATLNFVHISPCPKYECCMVLPQNVVWKIKRASVFSLWLWTLKASKSPERPHHTLDVWSYNKTLGEVMHVKVRIQTPFFLPENRLYRLYHCHWPYIISVTAAGGFFCETTVVWHNYSTVKLGY